MLSVFESARCAEELKLEEIKTSHTQGGAGEVTRAEGSRKMLRGKMHTYTLSTHTMVCQFVCQYQNSL
jgi:hypothetical protein